MNHSLIITNILRHPYNLLRLMASQRHLTMDSASLETVDLHHASFSTAGQTSAKPPLLILHGVLSSMDIWKKKAQAIHDETGRTVVTVDARNHGLSPHSPQHTYMHMAHDTARLINKLGLGKVSVLGHSMGGRTAMALSLLYPDLVSSMIVSDVSPRETSDQRKGFLSRSIDLLTKISRNFKPDLTFSEAKEEAYNKIRMCKSDERARAFVSVYLVQTTTGYDWSLNVAALKENLPNVTGFPSELRGFQYEGPTLFIAAGDSDYIRENDLEMIQEFFPIAKFVFVEGAMHTLPYDHPEKFLSIACKFLHKDESTYQ